MSFTRNVCVAIIICSTIGGIVATGIVLSSQKRHKTTYYDAYYENTDDFVHQYTTFDNTTEIITEQINVNTGGNTVSTIIGPTISPGYFAEDGTNNTRVPIWWDNFEGDTLNQEHWSIMVGNGIDGWGNGEKQKYTKDNVYVSEGAMHIMAFREKDEWFSGRVESKGAWNPGMIVGGKTVTKIYFDSNIHIPEAGNGLWPAFWFFPKEYVYGSYAASGEIDVMELRDGYDSITSGIHYGGQKNNITGIRNLRNMTRTSNVDKTSFANESFVFGVEWTLDTIMFFVNGVNMTSRHSKAIDPKNGWFSTAKNAAVSSPFDIPFKTIYNIGVGGNFPKFVPDNTTPDEVIMTIDYFHVFADFV